MILMNDFTREPEVLKQAMVQACERVIRSGWFVLGPEVEAFEQEWAAACGTRFGVGVGNGMDRFGSCRCHPSLNGLVVRTLLGVI